MGEVAKKKSATWRADAGSQKKKRKKRRRTKMKQHEKKGTKKETPVYLPSTVCWNTAPVFFFFFFFFFFMLLLLEKNSLWKEGDLFHELHSVLLSFLFYRLPGFEWCCEAAFDFRSSSFFSVFFWFVGSVCVCFHLMVDSLGEPRIFVGLCFRPGKTHTLKRKEKKKNGLSDRPVALPFIIIIIIF